MVKILKIKLKSNLLLLSVSSEFLVLNVLWVPLGKIEVASGIFKVFIEVFDSLFEEYILIFIL